MIFRYADDKQKKKTKRTHDRRVPQTNRKKTKACASCVMSIVDSSMKGTRNSPSSQLIQFIFL